MKNQCSFISSQSRSKGFTLIEVIFAIALLAFFIYFITNSFITTKKQHYMNSEHLTRVYIADVVVKLLKERIEVNPNFLAGINELGTAGHKPASSASCLVNPMAGEIRYRNLLEKSDYRVSVKDIPVISYTDVDRQEGFYFGFVAFQPGNDMFSGDNQGFKTFLNIDELAKYSYDLVIENDAFVEPRGVVKNIELTVRYNGRPEPDPKPFRLVTKIICPASSMSTAAYQKIQKNLFREIAQDIYQLIELDMAKSGFSLSVLVGDMERDCRASPFSAMKVMNLNMPENTPDRPRAEAVFKDVLALHCAIELYQQATSELDAELASVAGQNNVLAIVKVMDVSIQKAQWALQAFEAVGVPIDNILESLKPSGVAPPDPDAMFNYQVPILVMRYLLSQSENDSGSDRLSRFVAILRDLPKVYASSLQEAFLRVNLLLKENYKKLTPRQLQKYCKDMLAFHQMVHINCSRLRVDGLQSRADEYARQASATLDLLGSFYSGNDYLAGSEFIECEQIKLKQLSSFIGSRFSEIVNKIEGLNRLSDQLDKLQREVSKIDEVVRGQEEVKLVGVPYTVNMTELSNVYMNRGREAARQYLELCRQRYLASLSGEEGEED